MNTLFNIRSILSVCLIMMTNSLSATTVAAKKDGVKVFDKPSKRASVIHTLKKGDALEASERSGMYWKVQIKGSDGFISFMKVQRKAGNSSALTKAIKNAAHNSRDMDGVKTSRSRSAVMGVRGLDESNETSYAGNTTPNLRMVYAMEDLEVSKKKVQRLGDLILKEVGQRYNEQ